MIFIFLNSYSKYLLILFIICAPNCANFFDNEKFWNDTKGSHDPIMTRIALELLFVLTKRSELTTWLMPSNLNFALFDIRKKFEYVKDQ